MGGAALSRLLLFSGGMDSIALAWAIRPSLCLTVDYGHVAAAGEIRAAKTVCETLSLNHALLKVDLSVLGTGDMAGAPQLAVAAASDWWPFRNQFLITIAAAHALRSGLSTIEIGTVLSDTLHADGRESFIRAMHATLSLQEGSLALEAPAVRETTVLLCKRVNVPHGILAWAHSCHVSAVACGYCRGCVKHRESMRDLGYGEY